MAPTTAFLCWALAASVAQPCLGARLDMASDLQRDIRMDLSPYYGVPHLDVLHTSEPDEAARFLEDWAHEREFGLYIRVVPSDNKAFFPVRAVLIGICRGSRVLLFDLRPYLREVPTPMPEPISAFLENQDRLFYGMDLKRSAGRLAFEFDVVVRCVDYNIRAWPELKLGGGLYGVFNRFVSLDIDLWRPDSLVTSTAQARHTYLQWSVAHYFEMFYGATKQEWIITRAELFEAGPVYLRVAAPQHDWTNARDEWKKRKQERAASSIMRALQTWRNAERGESSVAAAPAAEAKVAAAAAPSAAGKAAAPGKSVQE